MTKDELNQNHKSVHGEETGKIGQAEQEKKEMLKGDSGDIFIEADLDDDMAETHEQQHGKSAISPASALEEVRKWLLTKKDVHSLYACCQYAKEDEDQIDKVFKEAVQQCIIRFHVVGCEGVEDDFWAITGGEEDKEAHNYFFSVAAESIATTFYLRVHRTTGELVFLRTE